MHRLMIADIPAVALVPNGRPRGLAVHVPPFGQVKEDAFPILAELSGRGLAAVAIDPWGIGERSHDKGEHPGPRVFSNFRRFMWPILGQTTLDVPRVVDWAQRHFGRDLPVLLSGLSMGGDIAIAAAGIDARVAGVVAVGSTPDWSRPGMADDMDPPQLMAHGEPDLYARFFYEQLDPITHAERYLRDVRLHLICGERDTHIRPDGAQRFKALVSQASPEAGERIAVEVVAGINHRGIMAFEYWQRTAAALVEAVCTPSMQEV